MNHTKFRFLFRFRQKTSGRGARGRAATHQQNPDEPPQQRPPQRGPPTPPLQLQRLSLCVGEHQALGRGPEAW